MNKPHTVLSWIGALAIALLFSCSPVRAQLVDRKLGEMTFVESSEQKDQFIAALEWSVEKRSDYVWPFESIKPAPYQSVRMLVLQMPRAWSEMGGKESVTLSPFRTLRVNDKSLPKPQRKPGSREEFQVYLDQGRLRFSFSLPPGFKLDPQNAIIRIRLYQVE